MLKATLALRCYSCTDMKLPYGNDNWYVNPCMNGTEMCSPCKGNLGEFVDCENGTCMASVGEGGGKLKFFYNEWPNKKSHFSYSNAIVLEIKDTRQLFCRWMGK